MNFQYNRYQVEPSPSVPDGFVYRPQVTLRLIGKKSEVFLWALVDTGADETIVPLSVAEEIGVDLDMNRQSQAGGVTGHHIDLLPGTVELELIGKDTSHKWSSIVSFARFENSDDECAILGHAGALEFFTATFYGDAHKGTLLPNQTFPIH